MVEKKSFLPPGWQRLLLGTVLAALAGNILVRLIPCLKNPRYISPAPGIRDQQNVSNLPFFFVILEYLHIDIGQPSKLFR